MTRGHLISLLLVMLGVSGCRRVALDGAPFGSPGKPAALHMYSNEWWAQLVDRPLLEYAPRETSTPAVDSDFERIFVATRDGAVRCLERPGRILWTFQTSAPFSGGLWVEGKVVYAPGGDGTLYALNAKTGALLWKYETGEELATTPVVDDGKVLFASHSDALFAVEEKTGKWLWQYRRELPSGFTIRGVSRPKVVSGVAYMGFADGSLVALNASDGTLKWEKSLSTKSPFTDVDTSPELDDNGNIYAASYRDGLYALDAETGQQKWHVAASGMTGIVRVGEVLFVSGEGQIAAYWSEGGNLLWATPFKGRATRTPVMAKGKLVFPLTTGLAFADPATGAIKVEWDPGAGVSATPLWSGSRLYVLSNMGFLYAMRL